MARAAEKTKIVKPGATRRKPRRPTATAAKTAAKAKGPPSRFTIPSKQASATLVPAPKASKEQLRVQVEKLECANATLRAKNREAGRAAKTAAARIAELEDQLARLGNQLAAQASGPGPGQVSSSQEGRRRARHNAIDPGDSVPPGVAVEEPAPPDLEAETARENLEQHLRGK